MNRRRIIAQRRFLQQSLATQPSHIRVRTPRLNGKVERSHRKDKEEFYQLLTYTGDVDLTENWRSGRTSTIIIARTARWEASRRTRCCARN